MIRCETCLVALQIADRKDNNCPTCKDYKGYFSKEFIKDLNDYCKDHYEHFNYIPLEFEWRDKVYKFEEYIDYVEFSNGQWIWINQ